MTVEVTIIGLIYRSPEYAKGLYQRLLEVTPSLAAGTTKFLFVANNANAPTLKTLSDYKIPHIVFNKPELTKQNHYDLGFAKPEYLGRVYAGYNFGISGCESKYIVLINSDMVFGPNWLEELIQHDDGKSIISCNLVERKHPRFGIFPGALEMNFGSSFKNLKWEAWLDFCLGNRNHSKTPRLGGAYMPALFRTQWFKEISMYPEGNIRNPLGGYDDVLYYGDEFLFRKFQESGIRHITSPGSFCYHFKEGERATELFPYFQNLYAGLRNFIRAFFR